LGEQGTARKHARQPSVTGCDIDAFGGKSLDEPCPGSKLRSHGLRTPSSHQARDRWQNFWIRGTQLSKTGCFSKEGARVEATATIIAACDGGTAMADQRNSESATDVKDQLKGMAGGVKDKVVDAAEDAKAKGVDQMAGVAGAVHGAADELSRELPQAAGYIHSVADRLESASSALRERSLEDLVSSLNRFTRRQPAAAFAGSVLAGFALSRFLKSSAAQPENRGQ
jgi:hypothetical protein